MDEASHESSGFSRRTLLLRLTGLSSLLLVVATWRLWTPQHVFPQVPLLALARAAWPLLDWLSLAGIVLGSLVLLIRPFGKLSLGGCGLLWAGYGTSIILDQHRLQPWAYQLLLISLALTLLSERMSLRCCRWLTVSIYAYSAWSKLDWTFLQPGGMGERFAGTLLNSVSLQIASPAMLSVGSWAIVMGEFAVALLLLIPSCRRIGVPLAIALHAALLLILGPLGLNHTLGVLCWNGVFLLFTPLLFWPDGSTVQEEPTPRSIPRVVAYGVIAFAIAWPLLEPLGYCDSWLAWSLYSSRNEGAVVLLDRSAVEKLPEHWKKYLRDTSDPAAVRFRLDLWSLEVLGAPVYPENRFRLGVVSELIDRAELFQEITVVLYGPADRWSAQRRMSRLQTGAEIEQQAQRYWFNSQPRE